VRTDMPSQFLELMTLFPQPVRRVPSVEVGDEPLRRTRKPAGPPSAGGGTPKTPSAS
jgi:hypothetical protein